MLFCNQCGFELAGSSVDHYGHGDTCPMCSQGSLITDDDVIEESEDEYYDKLEDEHIFSHYLIEEGWDYIEDSE